MPITTFRVRILILLLLIFLPASGEFLIQSNPIQISHNQAEMVFPGPITFSLNVAAGAPIRLVSLRYGTVGRTCAPAVYHENIKFSPASVLELSWSWNLQNQGQYLPPGAQVWWQWLIHTSDEQSQLTERQVMTVEDPDHPWKSLESAAIQLKWFDGDPAFGQMLLDTALQSRARLASETGLLTPEQLTLLVYPDGVSFQSATLDLPEWTGGVAFPEYDTVLAAIGPGQTDWARLVIPHEIAHLVIAARVFNCEGASLPLWMVEGFSKFAAGPLNDGQRAVLLQGLQTGELPDLQSLVNRFPYEAGQASRAYLVSLAAVSYLLEAGGNPSFTRLLDQVQTGGDFNQALLDIYGYRTETLNQAWQANLGFGEPPTRLPAVGSVTEESKPGNTQISSSSAIRDPLEPDFPLLPTIDWKISPQTLILALFVMITAAIFLRWLSQLTKR